MIHDEYSQRQSILKSLTFFFSDSLPFRRAHLKECFETLKKNVPNVDEKKTSNLSVLRSALRYIQVYFDSIFSAYPACWTVWCLCIIFRSSVLTYGCGHTQYVGYYTLLLFFNFISLFSLFCGLELIGSALGTAQVLVQCNWWTMPIILATKPFFVCQSLVTMIWHAPNTIESAYKKCWKNPTFS